MRYASVCSGIEAASVAFEPLGWEPAFFSEIEKFPTAVLAYHYPRVPNLGDFTQIGAEHGPVNLLVGGPPCQSFSIAGRRGGLDDPRGNLALQFIDLAARLRARWVVFENVPGLLSSNKGRDFGTLLSRLAERGYGFAYRILDAKHFGVPQRRRRVFVIGYFGGDWRPPAAVLFERGSLRRDTGARGKEGKELAARLAASSGGCNDPNRAGAFIPHLAGTLKGGSGERGYPDPSDGNGGGVVPYAEIGMSKYREGIRCLRGTNGGDAGGGSETLLAFKKRGGFGWSQTRDLSPTLENEGGSHTGGLERIPLVAALTARVGKGGFTDPKNDNLLAFGIEGGGTGFALRANPSHSGDKGDGGVNTTLVAGMGVRRLTPVECERLMGLPDNWTLVPYRGKPASDGPRYRAIGNSMAVPVVRWIGERIERVEAILELQKQEVA